MTHARVVDAPAGLAPVGVASPLAAAGSARYLRSPCSLSDPVLSPRTKLNSAGIALHQSWRGQALYVIEDEHVTLAVLRTDSAAVSSPSTAEGVPATDPLMDQNIWFAIVLEDDSQNGRP